jgi:hypothetical protein
MCLCEFGKVLRVAYGDSQLFASNARVQFHLGTDRFQADLRLRRWLRLGTWLAKTQAGLRIVGVGRLSWCGSHDRPPFSDDQTIKMGDVDMSGEIPKLLRKYTMSIWSTFIYAQIACRACFGLSEFAEIKGA